MSRCIWSKYVVSLFLLITFPNMEYAQFSQTFPVIASCNKKSGKTLPGRLALFHMNFILFDVNVFVSIEVRLFRAFQVSIRSYIFSNVL